MRRGSLVFAGGRDAAALPGTFVPAGAEAAVFWQLVARDLARHGGPFEALPGRSIERHLGDRAVGGKGELIFVG
jgi:formylmethanofuran dehydrogenase subunit C